MAVAKKLASTSASFDPKMATVDSVHQVVDLMLGMAGCPRCGRLSLLSINFASNPPNTKIPGVVNVEGQH
jgi:hypothetical protein